MSPPTIAQVSHGARTPRIRLVHGAAVLVAILGAACVVFAARFLDGPRFIDRITVENPTRYDIGIEVTSGDRDGWIAVGTVEYRETTIFEEIIDQGDVWLFSFSAQGEDGGELRVTRSDLERASWTVRIPGAVGDQLQERGVPFPPE